MESSQLLSFESAKHNAPVKSEYGWGLSHGREGYIGKCPYCDESLRLICTITVDLPPERYVDYLAELNIEICNFCGWWQSNFWQVDGVITSRAADLYISSAVLKAFEPLDTLDTPLSLLRDHLTRNRDTIYQIHTGKMEQLVASVFKDFFSCDVHHCGRSHDGGVDLYLVEGEDQIPIQVKRRESAKKAEPVETVRQLMGVMFRDQLRKAMIVTTADRFSRMARQERNKVLNENTCDQFELVDVNRFLDMLRAVASKDKPPSWVSAVPVRYIPEDKIVDAWHAFLDQRYPVMHRFSISDV